MSTALTYADGSSETSQGLSWKYFVGSKETMPKTHRLEGKILKSFPTIDYDVLFFVALQDISGLVGDKLKGWKEENHEAEKLLSKMMKRKLRIENP